METIQKIRSRIACVLADCGFSEAAAYCEATSKGDDVRSQVEDIVRRVIASIGSEDRA
jgi:hypothetical protein